MPWQSLNIKISGEHAVLLNEVLLALGAVSVSVEDGSKGADKDPGVFAEFGKPVARYWEHSLVKVLFPANTDIPAIMEKVRLALPDDPLKEYTTDQVADQDWVQGYRESCHPVKITGNLWVVPSWETPPDPAAVNIIMDPGLAFGSGTHASTKLCLSWLARNIRGGENVIDYGCGSGILGIAALKLGAKAVWGADIDDQALAASRKNAALNNVTFPVYHPDELPLNTADIILANILANTLKELAPEFAQRLKAGGRMVLAGITADQAEAVSAVYKEWFSFGRAGKEEEWVCLAGKRK